MIKDPGTITAERFAQLPPHMHYTGEPTAWVKVTRPGQRLHSFLEGACFDRTGYLWVVDVPYGRIFRIDPAGNWSFAFSYDGEPHSIKPWRRGTFAIVDYKRGLLSFTPDSGALETLKDGYMGQPFRGLSDLAVASDWDIWMTDPGRTSLSDPTGRVFRYSDSKLDLVLNNVPYPNGIALSPDGKFVYVAATRANAVWRMLAVSPENPPMVGTYVQLSGGLGPDGLAVDKEGHLAIAHAQAGRVVLCDAIGDVARTIRIPEGTWVTSVAFDNKCSHLYIVEAQFGTIWRANLGLHASATQQ